MMQAVAEHIGQSLKLEYKIIMTRETRIRQKLTAQLKPTKLVIRDVSSHHYGHAGWRDGEQTHFEVDIASSEFDGKTRLEAHRLVHTALAEELDSGLHALAIKIIS